MTYKKQLILQKCKEQAVKLGLFCNFDLPSFLFVQCSCGTLLHTIYKAISYGHGGEEGLSWRSLVVEHSDSMPSLATPLKLFSIYADIFLYVVSP